MSVVHFATELSGGAGSFVRHIHLSMEEMGLPSFVITRERNDAKNSVTMKPLTRFSGSLRAHFLTFLGKLGLIDSSYALFGIERSPVELSDIQQALEERTPTAFIFYWVSRFISFDLMLELRRAYPDLPFLFVCMDDALLTGGCHYSWGCLRYQDSCGNCPATSLIFLKKRIERGYRQRQDMISVINPMVIYPTTNMLKMGKQSAALKNTRSAVIPLGAISAGELKAVTDSLRRERPGGKDGQEKVTLLVRSSSEYRKGCDLFVSAVKEMDARMTDLRERLEVISIGDDTLAKARIDTYVKHIDKGYVSREGLIALYRDIDAFMVTSREDGGPLMVNECVALGIFVISTPIGVASDLIIAKENGLIAHDVSSAAISDTLTEYLYSHKTNRLEMANLPEVRKHGSSLTFEGYIRTMMDSIHTC